MPSFGYSLQFDGGDDRVTSVDVPLSTQFTYEAWVKRTGDNNQYQTFMSDANSSYGQAMFTLYVDGGNVDCAGATDQFSYYQAAAGLTVCSGVTATLNTWYHVAVSRDAAATFRFFVNGVLRATVTNAAAPTNSTGVLALGRAGAFNGEYFAGRLDEVRISNIAVYTTSFTPPTTPLTAGTNTVLLYHLDTGTGQTVTDSSVNNRHGVLGTDGAVQTTDPGWVADSPVALPN